MKVTIYNCYSEETQTFQGSPEQLRNQLNAAFPFLKRYNGQSLQEDLSKISQQQAYMVTSTED